jgi:hypothetical protein
MSLTTRAARRWLPVLGITAALAFSTACSPQQFKAWLEMTGRDNPEYTQEDYDQGSQVATVWWQWVFAEAAARQQAQPTAPQDKFAGALSDAGLARLRACESGGNYSAIGGGGLYRGAYQFHRGTWNSVANRHYPQYAGMDPAAAPPHVQDAMARALFAEQGRRPWPVCGQRI